IVDEQFVAAVLRMQIDRGLPSDAVHGLGSMGGNAGVLRVSRKARPKTGTSRRSCRSKTQGDDEGEHERESKQNSLTQIGRHHMPDGAAGKKGWLGEPLRRVPWMLTYLQRRAKSTAEHALPEGRPVLRRQPQSPAPSRTPKRVRAGRSVCVTARNPM